MKHTSTEICFAIETAELKILSLCKEAILFLCTKTTFVNRVNGIIKEALDGFPEHLKERFTASLRTYATQTLQRERILLLLRVSFFAAILAEKKRKKPDAVYFERELKTSVNSEYFNSPGFKKLLEQAKDYDITSPTALPLNMYHKEYQKKVRDVTERLIRSDAKEDYSSNVNLRNIAEMTVRYEHQTEMIENFKNNGTKLVYIVPHANCSKRCEKYQVGGSEHPSGLYSLDGTSGTTPEGVKYVPLEFATDNPKDSHTTKNGKVYQNGCITGFNCRHKLKAYEPGNKPLPIPEKEIERRRNVEERQRSYERQIREYSRAALVVDNREKAKELRERASDKYAEYRSFCEKNNVAYYPERTSNFDID